MLSRFRRLFVYLLFVAAALLLVCLATAAPVPAHSYFAEGNFLVIAHRGGMHDDPVVFALVDKVSRVVLVLCAIVVAGAI